MDKLLEALRDNNQRLAQFKTVIALNLKNSTHLFEGIVHGNIAYKRKGTDGFGYDPIFKPLGYALTFAELPISKKNEIGHRGLAIRKLVGYLSKCGQGI